MIQILNKFSLPVSTLKESPSFMSTLLKCIISSICTCVCLWSRKALNATCGVLASRASETK